MALSRADLRLVWIAYRDAHDVRMPDYTLISPQRADGRVVHADSAFHEFSHAIVAKCTGARVKAIELSPREGGVTVTQGGSRAFILSAGYMGSALIGALLLFCGFSIVASKVASIVLGVCFLLTLWWGRRDWLTILTVVIAVGLLVACWFIAHALALKFFVLFLGVMSCLYSGASAPFSLLAAAAVLTMASQSGTS